MPIPDDVAARDWLALNRAPGLDPPLLAALLARYPTPRAALEGARREPAAVPLPPRTRTWLAAPDWDAVDGDLAWLEPPGRHLLHPGMPEFPECLRHVPDPPAALFVSGDPGCLGALQIAMVGSRRATPDGCAFARRLAGDIAAAGLAVTSGLAYGADAAAHRGALEAGGTSIAVSGCGPERIYPATHRALAQRIAAAGALVTEFPPGTAPRPENFPRRNRLISGLALGVVVVEATRRSGSLVTARLAAEQGREVFAVPGPPGRATSRGCHDLIRAGACLVESAAQVLDELSPEVRAALVATARGSGASRAASGLDRQQRRVLESVGDSDSTFESVVRRSALTPETVSSILCALELQGLVQSAPGGLYRRLVQEP